MISKRIIIMWMVIVTVVQFITYTEQLTESRDQRELVAQRNAQQARAQQARAQQTRAQQARAEQARAQQRSTPLGNAQQEKTQQRSVPQTRAIERPPPNKNSIVTPRSSTPENTKAKSKSKSNLQDNTNENKPEVFTPESAQQKPKRLNFLRKIIGQPLRRAWNMVTRQLSTNKT